MNPIFLIAFLVMLTVLAAFVGMYRWLRVASAENEILKSLNYAEIGWQEETVKYQRVNKELGRFAIAGRIEKQLIESDSKLTVAEFLLIRVGLVLVCILFGWAISGQIIGGMLLAALGWMIPSYELQRRQARRTKLFAEQLPDMLSLLAGSLRAGYGLLHACRVVKDEMPDPISTEFDRVIRETSLGYSLDEALDHLVERVDSDDLELVVTSIHVQNEVGGSLAEILETITETIRERVTLKGEIRVMTSQQRLSGWILSLLPLGIGTVLMLLNPAYMMEMFQPGLVLIIPISAVVMVILGNISMRWVMKIDI